MSLEAGCVLCSTKVPLLWCNCIVQSYQYNQLTNSTDQVLQKLKNLSATQEFTRIWRNPTAQWRFQKARHSFLPPFFKIHKSSVRPASPKSSKVSVSLGFPCQTLLFLFFMRATSLSVSPFLILSP